MNTQQSSDSSGKKNNMYFVGF